MIGDVLGYALIAGGSIAVGAAWLWPMLGKRGAGSSRTPRGLMTIREAAQLMYNRANQDLREMSTSFARFSRANDRSPIDYFADAMAVLASSKLVSIFGRKAAGLVLEKIPPEYFDEMIEIKGNDVGSIFGHGRIDWYDLHISKRDALEGLREYEIDAQRLQLRRDRQSKASR